MKYNLQELIAMYEKGHLFVEGLQPNMLEQSCEIKSLDKKIYYYRLECLGQGLLVAFLYCAYGRKGIQKFLSARRQSDNYLSNNLGLYPIEDWLLEQFCELSIEVLIKADYLGCWKKNYLPEQYLVQKYGENKQMYFDTKYNNIYCEGHFGSLYWFNRCNWFEKLQNKKILVISSHSETMKRQWTSDRLFKSNNLNYGHQETNIQLEFIKPPMSMCRLTPHGSWLDSLEHLKGEISRLNSRFDFDIALVSCGAYGGPICSYINSLPGKSVFYVGGALQLYFCIKGRRWDCNNIYNEHWISVDSDEIPPNYQTVEGGCYF